MDKRTFLKTSLILSAGTLVSPVIARNTNFISNDEFEQVKLKYGFDALEPYIDAQTMELHYTKHHAGYTAKFNAAVKQEGLSGLSIEDIFNHVDRYSTSVRNNGGGYYNHNLFWQFLTPKSTKMPVGNLARAIKRDFGSFEDFKSQFSKKAATVFGSGWAWLIQSGDKLKIISTSNQDNPLMSISENTGTPLLCLDVWEHAYYLNYQNRRTDYINAFWNIVDWDYSELRYNNV